MRLIENAYLPKGKITVAVGSVKRDDMCIIKPCTSLKLPPFLKGHGDLSFCYLGQGRAVCAKGSGEYYKKALEKYPIHITEGGSEPDMHYPLDAAYNIAIVGKRVFCKTDTADKILLDECERMGYKIIHINQGYSKCSVCPVDENSAISADKGFYKAAAREGLEVLLITNRSILLPGYNTGFFGGCAYMEEEKTLAINGDISLFPDKDKIISFLEGKNIRLNCKKGVPLLDFGSLIPLCEE